MSANRFNAEGCRVDSQEEFLRLERDGEWKNLLYFPEEFGSSSRRPLVLTAKKFIEVSFGETDIQNVRFIRCSFERCSFMGASLTDCELTNCVFIDTK